MLTTPQIQALIDAVKRAKEAQYEASRTSIDDGQFHVSVQIEYAASLRNLDPSALHTLLSEWQAVVEAAAACERDAAGEQDVSREHWLALFKAVEAAEAARAQQPATGARP